MSAFADMMAALMADENMATPALHKQGGAGPAIPVRVVRSRPDEVGQAFGAPVVLGAEMLLVSAAEIPGPAPGDTFTIGAEVLTVTAALIDETATAWRLSCRRA